MPSIWTAKYLNIFLIVCLKATIIKMFSSNVEIFLPVAPDRRLIW
jgi:hypothetical protein